jgi:DNA-binding transcriptional LysR family regulator
MELRHLRYFLAVADERQFTRAAARLHIQQPPLSQQIHELERELGYALFTRLARGVELTPAGAAFADGAQHVLAALENAVRHATRVAHGETGSVRVGLTSSAAFHPLVPAAIRRFRETHRDIALDLAEINAADIIEMMVAGGLDVAILRKPTESPEALRFDLLCDEEMVLVLPIDHPLAASTRIRLKALQAEPFIFVRRPGAPGMYADFIRACEQAGFAPRVVGEVPRMVTAINLVAAGTGITLVPASMQRYRQESVVYRTVLGGRAIRAPLNLVTHAALDNPAALRFAQTVKAFAVGREAATSRPRARGEERLIKGN